ncbi:Bombesin receptor-like,G protein-coupled receptor, rhodopsin-like,GPCR, rhodopsin-like, 7TM [Cinara cedri]|uniref:Bombesin receptor-like,G protein-coupled receptor, rhodopsin-like,GPCR, rhodopsin-like, 7TM n=1 Tax=Cinara cedri TaxID=506608 RepID=A0A5E4NG37_9HEMI|nr:Bombesin receptor-like,G protein-coupled receptor, rhodopsin-like,GPCR, rhodopsin-like, 7TM [Cinara cedri]
MDNRTLQVALAMVNDSANMSVDAPNGYDYADRLETYIVPALFALIFVVGTVGNGTLVLIFVRHKHMRNVPNIYILNLALGDLLVIISCVPFTSTVYTFPSWPYGLAMCKVSETAKDVSIGVSVFTLTALSADRYFAIVNPMRKIHASVGGRFATRFTVTVAAAIWAAAAACAAPAFRYSYIRQFRVQNITLFEVCYPYPDHLGPAYPKVVVLVKFLVYYAVPLTIIACFYVLIARYLVQTTNNMPGELQGKIRQVRARKKVAKSVLAFVLMFAICFLPHHVFMLWFYNYPKSTEEYNTFWHVLRIAGFCMSFTNSCMNPVALYLVSGTFRKHFDRHLFSLCVSVQPTTATESNLFMVRKNHGTTVGSRIDGNCGA